MSPSVLLLLGSFVLFAGCASHEVVVSHTAPQGVTISSYGRHHLVVTPVSEADARRGDVVWRGNARGEVPARRI